MDTYEFLDAYEKMLENETLTTSDAPLGAMSSGPILKHSLENPKLGIYTVFKKNCKDDNCIKEFDSKKKALDFIKDNKEWELNNDS